MRALRVSPLLGPLVLLAAVASCGDRSTSGAPEWPPILRLTNASGADTISAPLPALLTAQVHDAHGRPFVGIVVRFDASYLPIPTAFGNTAPAAAISTPDSTFGHVSLAKRTDGNGEVQVRVTLGRIVGPVKITVTVPEAGISDTAHFTAKPGHAAQVHSVIADTTIFVGASFQVQSKVIDQWSNIATEQPTFVAGPSIASIDAAGNAVAGSAAGRGWVAIRVGALTDTMRVTVVPRFALVAAQQLPDQWYGLTTAALDGTSRRVVLKDNVAARWPRWSPDGGTILFYEFVDVANMHLFTLTSDGVLQRVIASPPANLTSDYLGALTPDGQWVYFTGLVPFAQAPYLSNLTAWRVHPDGTGAEELLRTDGSPQGTYPAASPNGKEMIVTRDGILYRVDLATSASFNLGYPGERAQYSPRGDAVVYIEVRPGLVGPLWVMSPDGSNRRQLTPDARPYGQDAGFGWSPDGNFIIAAGPGGLELIRVSDGVILPLPFASAMTQPSLRQY